MANKQAVLNILKGYPALTDTQKKNFLAIINHGRIGGSGKLVILPVDQGFEHGPGRSFESNPIGYDAYYHAHLAVMSGCNAYAAPLGALELANDKIEEHELPTILKVNSNDLMMPNSADPFPAITSWVDDAARLRCEAVGFTIYPGSAYSREMYQQARDLVRDARKAGLIVVIWAYPRGSGLPSKEAETALDVICYGVHIACQLGAHIVKAKPVGKMIYGLPDNEKRKIYDTHGNADLSTLAKRTAKVVQAAFNGKRILINSGGDKKTEAEILAEIRELKAGGSLGSIIGRNAFQRPFDNAVTLLREVQNIWVE
ncbi:MAG: class I fructose-bisphosphate aldolase [Candidatus Nealsonbacteria bacterium]|nr:class I fructose-bisphosphate aldolase [Candidatus Nealsonbacteria bacterium]